MFGFGGGGSVSAQNDISIDTDNFAAKMITLGDNEEFLQLSGLSKDEFMAHYNSFAKDPDAAIILLHTFKANLDEAQANRLAVIIAEPFLAGTWTGTASYFLSAVGCQTITMDIVIQKVTEEIAKWKAEKAAKVDEVQVITEDEQLRRALEQSLQTGQLGIVPQFSNLEDEDLRRALAASMEDANAMEASNAEGQPAGAAITTATVAVSQSISVTYEDGTMTQEQRDLALAIQLSMSENGMAETPTPKT